MFTNYVAIALRHIQRHPGSACINIFGLAVGMACCMIILLFVREEFSYDRHDPNVERIYRVGMQRQYPNGERHFAVTPKSLADALVNDFPEIAAVTRFRDVGNPVVRYEDKAFVEDRLFFAEANFFDVFTVPFLQGNPQAALQKPGTVVITESTAIKYFGTENPIGKTFETDFGPYTVSAVTEDMPPNTHFQFHFLLTLTGSRFMNIHSWVGLNTYTYLLLKPDAPPGALTAKFPEMVQTHARSQIESWRGPAFVEKYTDDLGDRYFLQPLRDIHLYSQLEFEIEPNGDIVYVYLFGGLSLFILLIACVNFMNLATARSVGRAREVGMRKTLGAGRAQLAGQFLMESVSMSLLAMVLAIGLTEITLPWFNVLSGKSLDIHYFDGQTLPVLIGLVAVTGGLAGSYPAFVLSSFRPVAVLTGSFAGVGGTGLRSILVVFQFATSAVLLACTLIIFGQMDYIRTKRLGFDKEQIIVIEKASALRNQSQTFRQTLLGYSSIISISSSNSMPGSGFNEMVMRPEGTNEKVPLFDFIATYGFLETMGMDLATGRGFSEETVSDTTSVILINQTAASQLGWENSIGKNLILPMQDPARSRSFTIIGVVQDFNFRSLHEEIGPLMIRGMDPQKINLRFLVIRIRPEDVEGTLAFLENTWENLVTDTPFMYFFLDDRIDALYRSEQNIGRIMQVCAGLAILIACMGLLGLVGFVTEQRTKEIGIRKVLGASVPGITLWLLKHYFILIAIAFFIAIPLVYYIMNTWLQNFAYRVGITPEVFLITAVVSVLFLLLTVGYHSIRAARVNPAETLRYE